VSSVVPHYMAPCWFTLDPASLLATSHYDHGQIPELPPEMLAQEYYTDDVHDMAAVARSPRGLSTLHDASGGDPSDSPRWQANMRYGGDQELLVALRTQAGDAWGILGLYREPGQPHFDADELGFLRNVARPLAEGARRGLLIGEAADPEGPAAPGLVVLDRGVAGRIAHGRRRALAGRTARRGLGGPGEAAVSGPGGRGTRAAFDGGGAGAGRGGDRTGPLH
jgi:hypothetical protein